MVKVEEHQERPKRPFLTAQPREYRTLVALWPQLCLIEGVLCRRRLPKGRRKSRLQAVIPSSLWEEALELYHDNPATVHFGEARCLDALCQQYWWPGVKKDVRRWIRSCEVCAKVKAHPQTRTHGGEVWTSSPRHFIRTADHEGREYLYFSHTGLLHQIRPGLRFGRAHSHHMC